MKKRKGNHSKLLQNSLNMSTSLDQTARPAQSTINKQKPQARDGHTSFVYKNKMFIFGGDRHHMPFNDLFYLDLHI